jgi:hypothetical protein
LRFRLLFTSWAGNFDLRLQIVQQRIAKDLPPGAARRIARASPVSVRVFLCLRRARRDRVFVIGTDVQALISTQAAAANNLLDERNSPWSAHRIEISICGFIIIYLVGCDAAAPGAAARGSR